MKDLVNMNLTMSSLEIAKLTGKEHFHVTRDIDKMLRELEDSSIQVWMNYKDASGKTNRLANLNKELTYTLVAGYSIKLRNVIIKRWLELEAQQPQLPQTYLGALKDLVRSEERNLLLTQQLEEAKPKLEYMEKYTSADNTKAIRETAKILKIPERTFTSKLKEYKIMYVQGGTLLPYQPLINKGFFTVRTGVSNGHVWHQTRVTATGLQWLSQQLNNRTEELQHYAYLN